MHDDLRRLRALIYGAALSLPITACTPSGEDPQEGDEAVETTETSTAEQTEEEWPPDEVEPSCDYEERCVPCPEDPSVQAPPAPIPAGSALARREGDTCCYMVELGCMGGRALWIDDTPRIAPLVHDRAWSRGSAAPSAPGAVSSTIAARWAEQGLAEHASIASFARATLELMALGAPPDLIQRSQAASIDEVHHARACFALAEAADGVSVGPGPLPAAAPRALGAAELALAVFDEACVGETLATLIALRQHGVASHPQVRQTLARIMDDEARHAALGWDTLAWLLREAPDARVRLSERAVETRSVLRAAVASASEVPEDPHHRAWGLLGAGDEARAALDAFDGLVIPALDQLIRGTPQTTHTTLPA